MQCFLGTAIQTINIMQIDPAHGGYPECQEIYTRANYQLGSDFVGRQKRSIWVNQMQLYAQYIKGKNRFIASSPYLQFVSSKSLLIEKLSFSYQRFSCAINIQYLISIHYYLTKKAETKPFAELVYSNNI